VQREITLDGRTSATTSPVKPKRTKPASKKATGKSSPISSPEKSRKTTSLKPDVVKSKSLHNFFGRASEEQRWQRKSRTPEVEVEAKAELSDAIEDDDLSDGTLQELGLRPAQPNYTALDRRKSTLVHGVGNLRNAANGSGPLSSQRFVKTSLPSKTNVNSAASQDGEVEGHRPWSDRYGPTNLEELMVHKKKVTDVQTWLQGKIDGKNSQKLLILKGPAGSGKTMTVSLLAKSLHLQTISWHNPVVAVSTPNNSINAQFDDFLNRGGQYGSLAFDRDASHDASSARTNSQLLVIEEFPATMTRSSNVVQSFRSVLLRFLSRGKATASAAFHTNGGDVAPPLIIIISETLLSSSTALSDSFTAHRLLGPEILNHPFVTMMEFNPVAPTLMTKALDLVAKKEARDSKRRRTPGPGVIARLAEIGDIRSAVNSLEFLCLHQGDGSEWSGTVAAKVKRSNGNAPLTESEKNSLALISQRESTLDMFHATGKIVWNKREDPRVLDTRAEPPPKPPDHLMHLYTPKASQVDIEALLNETGTDIQTFISTLHENYVLSCGTDKFEESFDGCSEILSVSDVLNPENRPNRRGQSSNPNASLVHTNVQSASSDSLRQDEISFQVATRGLLFNLPCPVNRAAVTVPGSKRGDAYKMFYPASLRLWKPIEEMQGLLDMLVQRDGALARKPITFGIDYKTSDSGVASWQARSFGLNTAAPRAVTIKKEPLEVDNQYPTLPDFEADDATSPPAFTYTKDVLKLELLPYETQILSARMVETSLLEKITKFKPTNYLSTRQDNFEEEDEESIAVASAGNGSFASTRPSSKPPERGANLKMEESTDELEKLYIEDDDIEDD
jgi:cell cycle checkpoint protein